MWKSTSFASVSQYKMKRVDGDVASVRPRFASAATISARLVGLRRDVRRADHPGVVAEHAHPAGVAVVAIRLIDRHEDRGERVARPAGAHQRIGEQAMAGHVIGAVGDRAAIGVDDQVGRRGPGLRARREAREPLAGEPPHVGAAGEQIDDRAVDPRGGRRAAAGLERIAEPDQREHVAGLLGVPVPRARHRFRDVMRRERLLDRRRARR